jgi:hypothetical protein
MSTTPRVRRVFWDIETSPNICYTWRIGGKIYLAPHTIIKERAIICICWKWEGQKKVHHLTWSDGDDAYMLAQFANVIERADEMVAHNGDKFDLRWFNARNLMNNLDPVPAPKTIDTYKIAKKNFELNSYRLDYLAKMLLGIGKIKTDFDLWKGVMDGNKSAMSKMVKYCKRDVELLELVWQKLRDYENASTHAAVNASGNVKDRWKCAHCASDNVHITAKGMKQHQMICDDCGRYYTVADLVFRWYREAREM